MKIQRLFVPVVAVLFFAACGGGANKSQTFAAADGSVTATVKKGEWKIVDAQGREPMEQYDSMRVIEVGVDGHPVTVAYFKGSEQLWLQYYSTMQLRSRGLVKDGLREGRWVFYHPNGLVQTECTFVNGLEDGSYRVFRDNGAPYYVGRYEKGRRVGTWEAYDQEGNLAGTQNYDE